jgi:hypothetical protein
VHEITLVLDSGASSRRRSPRRAEGRRGHDRAGDRGRQGRRAAQRRRHLADEPRAVGAVVRRRRVPAYSFVPVPSAALVAVLVHDTLPDAMPELVLGSRKDRWLWRLKIHAVCRRANLMATLSDASAREIRRRLPVGDRPIVVLGGGVSPLFTPDPDPCDRERVDPIVGPSVRPILYVGGLSRHKRVPEP